jgi:hypothetical protein
MKKLLKNSVILKRQSKLLKKVDFLAQKYSHNAGNKREERRR